MTDPKVMAAQIRAWANVVQRLYEFLDSDRGADGSPTMASQRALDLCQQMRSVAAREDNAYPDRAPKPSWEHRGEERS